MRIPSILLFSPFKKSYIKATSYTTKTGKLVNRMAHTDKRKAKSENYKGARQKIEDWVKKEFNPKYVEKVITDLIDVAAGNREGNAFEKDALERILGKKGG